jgi:hypothetical protein
VDGGTLAVADVASAEDSEKAALQNAIEMLRDPSRVRMLPVSELVALITRPEMSIVSKPRPRLDKMRGWASLCDGTIHFFAGDAFNICMHA